MKKIEKLNQLVADFHFLNVKFHNLHWNVVGMEFASIHEFTEEAYNEFFAKYDEVAERLKMLGNFPPASIKEYSSLTNISELENKDYKPKEVLDIIEESYEYLLKEFNELRELADSENDFITVALSEDYIASFTKTLWFVKSMKK